MKNISKKNQSVFINQMKEELLKMGAVTFISDPLQFDLKTKKYGVLWLRIDEDQSVLYTVYGRFLSTKNLPDFENVNTWSGKWNHHLSGENHPFAAVSEVVQNIKLILN